MADCSSSFNGQNGFRLGVSPTNCRALSAAQAGSVRLCGWQGFTRLRRVNWYWFFSASRRTRCL